MKGSLLASNWEAFAEDPAATLSPIASSSDVALELNFSIFGLCGAAIFMKNVAAAEFIRAGFYTLYELASDGSKF